MMLPFNHYITAAVTEIQRKYLCVRKCDCDIYHSQTTAAVDAKYVLGLWRLFYNIQNNEKYVHNLKISVLLVVPSVASIIRVYESAPVMEVAGSSEMSLHIYQTFVIIVKALQTSTLTMPVFTHDGFSFIFMFWSCRLQYFTDWDGMNDFTVIKQFWNKHWTLAAVLTHSYERWIT
jgi:hypothetical protein